jgi:hypothetical protein
MRDLANHQPERGKDRTIVSEPILPTIGDSLAEEIDTALQKAIKKHAPFNSAHEGWAVIWEEVDELWDEVRAWQPADHRRFELRKEAIHVAAMAIRFIKDVCDKDEPGS